MGEEKEAIRRYVWKRLEEGGVTRFPKPVLGRIPNFAGAEKAANLLRGSEAYRRAEVVKVNPDSPQRPVREMTIMDGKTLVMPTPRIRHGFLMLRGGSVPQRMIRRASTIGGMYKLAKSVEPSRFPKIDLVVLGSVAVSRDGWRLGKGEGYAELEYAILREVGAVDEDTPVYTSVHDLQLVDMIPHTAYDLPVDKIFTNTVVLGCPRQPKPHGVIWEMLKPQKLAGIPLLAEMYRRRKT
ncbi:MAG: 5-formyltetrahydrofolate cyclo-ligase [Nitrososphaerota archaeon]